MHHDELPAMMTASLQDLELPITVAKACFVRVEKFGERLDEALVRLECIECSVQSRSLKPEPHARTSSSRPSDSQVTDDSQPFCTMVDHCPSSC